jgi:hypothetical protein
LRRKGWPPKVTGFQIASCRRQPYIPARSSPALRPPMFLGALHLFLSSFIPAKRALRPGMILASLASRHVLRRHCVRRCFSAPCVSSIRITSPDASPGIATWHDPRQPCVPARSSPALRLISPVTGSLSSLVSEANLSTTLFLVD